jgi:uncharacterized protein (DUF1800 family)
LALVLVLLCCLAPLWANRVESRDEAALFLEQATWGPKPSDIDGLMATGKSAFLEAQFAAPVSRYPAPANTAVNLADYQKLFYVYGAQNPDQLRQRVAFALGQILVVSGNTLNRAHMMVPYMNLLADGAFGNYRDLLVNVSLSPAMGRYLDNVNNVKADPSRGTSPNENYSREFLQLFTLGTEVLQEDGTPARDASGAVIPVYTEDTVKELARAFTGWRWAPNPDDPSRKTPNNLAYYGAPMVPWDPFHDDGAKMLLNGYQIPAGRTTRENLEDAVTHIFNHPNLPTFVSIRLIRSLVTSNPSPGYVRDVVAVFKNNGSGVRGDLKAVVRAILLHPEASGPLRLSGAAGLSQGHLTEPVLYVLKLLRSVDATVEPNNNLNRFATAMGQNVFIPNSVFNYFHLDHMLTKQDLAGPEFEIHTSATSIERANFVARLLDRQLGPGVSYSFDSLAALAANPDNLIKELATRLTHGSLPDASRTIVKTFVSGTNDAGFRVNRAFYLVANSPQSWVSGARLPESRRRAPRERRRVYLQ